MSNEVKIKEGCLASSLAKLAIHPLRVSLRPAKESLSPDLWCLKEIFKHGLHRLNAVFNSI
jgi:hypothetical protein